MDMTNFNEIMRRFSEEYSRISLITIRAFTMVCEEPGIAVDEVIKRFDREDFPASFATITRSLQILEDGHSEKQIRLGLIEKVLNSTDKRNKLCYPTKKGEELYEECILLLRNEEVDSQKIAKLYEEHANLKETVQEALEYLESDWFPHKNRDGISKKDVIKKCKKRLQESYQFY